MSPHGILSEDGIRGFGKHVDHLRPKPISGESRKRPWLRRGARFGYMSSPSAAPVAQLDRVLPSEGRGHRFESCRVRHN